MFLKSCEVYDPKSNTWTPVASMALPRQFFGMAALADGRVLVAGGMYAIIRELEATDKAEIYDPTTDTWSGVAPLGTARFSCSMAAAGSGAAIVGGMKSSDGSGPALASVEVFTP
jgi:N-acetylneuraminic acid mutarotase